MRVIIPSTVMACLITISTCACGQEHGGVGASATGTTSSETFEPAPEVDGRRLTAAFTYDQGIKRFDPLAASYEPAVSASQAVDLFKESNLASYAPGLSSDVPEEFLAAYTTVGLGLGVRGEDPTELGWDHEPTWVLRFTGVPWFFDVALVGMSAGELRSDVVLRIVVVGLLGASVIGVFLNMAVLLFMWPRRLVPTRQRGERGWIPTWWSRRRSSGSSDA